MKIVIDIDNETYGRIQALVNADYFEHDICGYLMQRIANGTPYEERPQGHWINRCRGSSFCSVCGCEEPTEDIEFMNYCSNCGAKMTNEVESE